ncbi:MAG TPA: multidrug efflux RND transporter permease subunit [Anaeromyxobacteraceae bacterium]|nr:multidrug efflux RND transporter permease subunit [Anaeromyxobacteraceae bacterium]
MSRFFIGRPIVAMVIAIVMVIVGTVSLARLPVSQYPDIVPPMIQVTTTYTGASAVDVEQTVAVPIENQVNGVPGMIYMNSYNASDGTYTLQVSFEVGTNIDMDTVLTQNRAGWAQASLPNAVKQFGVETQASFSFPMMLVTLHSPEGRYDNNFLSNYAAINISPVLARSYGVGQATLFGGSNYSMRVWVRPDRLKMMDLTVSDLVNAIKEQNVLVAAGQFGGPPAVSGTSFTYTARTRGRLLTAEEFGDIIIRAQADGTLVRLKDIARIELGTQLYNSQGRLDGKPAAGVEIFQLPGSNALRTASAVRAAMNGLSKSFPPGLEYEITLDTTAAISAGITEIVKTLFEAVLLVLIVVFVFLQNWRATIIPMVTVPVSLLGAFAAFPLLGFSVNTLSLLGMVLAIGLVVDDAIVVVEAVSRHIEEGMTPRDAAIQAMKEVGGPVVAIALVLSSVFIPVAFIGGISGQLYQQFAITIAVSVILSAINALTLSPALCALLLRPSGARRSLLSPFYDRFNRVFAAFTNGYLAGAGFLGRKLVRSAILVGLSVALAVALGMKLPTGFMPEEDNGYCYVNIALPDAASLERTTATVARVEDIIRRNPAVKYMTTVTGFSLLSRSYAPNTAFIFLSLKPWDERKGKGEVVFDLMRELNARFAVGVPEGQVFSFGPPAIVGLGNGGGFDLFLQDHSNGTPEYLAENAAKFLAATAKRPEIEGARTDFRATVPQAFVDVDRDKVAKLGVPLYSALDTLGTYLGGSYVNQFNRFGQVYDVYVQAEADYRRGPADLGLFYVRGSKGNMVGLDTLADVRPASGPQFTNRFNLFRSAEVVGSNSPAYSSGQAMQALEETAAAVLPGNIQLAWTNVSYQEKKAQGTAGPVFIVGMVMVFLILAALYESWSLPFAVLLGTPFAAFGALFGLWLARFASPTYVDNVFAQIGLLMLVGLAAKNAILIVEYAKATMDEKGVDPVAAALEAAKVRFRPILMTSFAFILGVFPLVRASGAGAESRKVMGMAVFSGMLVGTFLAVFLVPSLFIIVEILQARFGKKKGTGPGDTTGGPGASAPPPEHSASGAHP